MVNLNLEKITIRFSGDSGDGIQIIGNQISNSSVTKSGNEIFTFQEFPSEIRAPACSLSGISSFQISISNKKIYSIDDEIDILVALNPAAIKKNIRYLKNNSLIIVDSDSLNNKNFKRAGFKYNTLFYKYIKKFKILKIPITRLTYDSCKSDTVSVSQAKRSKNFFCLGLIFNIYNRKIDIVFSWIKNKFQKNIAKSNIRAMIAGYNYVNNIEILKKKINVTSFKARKLKTHLISGNKAITLAIDKISKITNKKIFSASYPITPASDILHELIKKSNKKLIACQMEDEISAVGATIGASYGGSLAFTFTSGPGIDLMQESIGLAIMAEIPILIIDIQRSGPSTGMPTKSEQTDLMSSIFGSHGEGTPIVIAPKSPSDCFWSTIECFKIAEKLAHPVILLSDSNMATSSEIWEEPEDYSIVKEIDIITRNTIIDCKIPGKYNHQKCIGGLERDSLSGEVSQDPNNHYKMIKKRQEKLDILSRQLSIEVLGYSTNILIISWGSVCGVIRSIYEEIKKSKYASFFSFIMLRYLNPIPKKLDNIVKKFKKIIVIEENSGQLYSLMKFNFNVEINKINKITGEPFSMKKLLDEIIKNVKE